MHIGISGQRGNGMKWSTLDLEAWLRHHSALP